MKIKWFFLFGLIGMPVCVYLFLQAFGENHFEITVYFPDGLENTMEGCEEKPTNGPYSATMYDAEMEQGKVVVYDLGSLGSGDKNVKNNLLTFLNKFKRNDGVKLVSLNVSKFEESVLSGFEQFGYLQGTPDQILGFGRCVLQSDLSFDSTTQAFVGSQLVLCDKDRKIRGYYDPTELMEIDRLNTELYILLNN